MEFRALALAAAFATAAAVAPDLGCAAPQADGAAAVSPGMRFKCQEGGDLVARFDARETGLVAVVDAGEGPRTLPLRPWTGGPVRLTWTDGQRTLTWSPGVQIMWMDGEAHRMCGREGHHH